MRRKTLLESGDSLDLLLDTMCNLFGGIVFIALLVALLAGESANKRADFRSDTEEVLLRQIEHLTTRKSALFETLKQKRTHLEKALSLISDEKLAEVVQEKNLNSKLESELSDISEQNALIPNAIAIQEQISKSLENQQRLALSLKNEEKAFEEEIMRLEKRGKALRERSRELAEERIWQVRLPKETDDFSRENAYIIMQYGKMYPVYLPNSGNYSEFIGKETISDGPYLTNDRIWAIENQGLAKERDMTKFFQQIDNRYFYPFFIVYPDSFSTFLEARRVAQDLGVDYGLMFHLESEPVILSPTGKKHGTQ